VKHIGGIIMLHHSRQQGFLVSCVFFLFGILSSATGAETQFPKRNPTSPHSVHKAAVAAGAMQSATTTALQLAEAMDVPADSIVNASLGDSDPLGAQVFTFSFGGFPVQENSFAAISSGNAAFASLPNTSESLSYELSGINNSQGNDLVQLTLTLTVPAGAKFWSVDWKFLSEEYAEYVGSLYNDAFFIETPGTDIIIMNDVATSQTNVALDTFGSRVSINTTGASGMTASNAQGTTFDGATGIVTTVAQIPPGASQITIVFSVTDLGDSIYDTTVFLDNFKFLDEYVTSQRLDPPGIRLVIPENPISLDKPTVVLTHGISAAGDFGGAPDTLWIGAQAKEAAALIKAETGGSVNIIHYVWENAFQAGYAGALSESAYNSAQSYAHDAGENLAKELLKPEYLGPSYNGKIHFIGHSLGSIVNAYAARAFLSRATNVKSAQFTALDKPDHVKTQISGCLAFPGCRGYGKNFFGDIFQEIQTAPGRELNLVIDNYFSKSGSGLGDRTNGLNIYNHEELINPSDVGDAIFSSEVPSNNHSGVQQWYRWTMDSNGLYPSSAVCNPLSGELLGLPLNFHSSLDPCNNGWKRSIVRPNALNPVTESIPSTSAYRRLLPQEFKSHGCLLTTPVPGIYGISCSEPSSPSGIAEVDIPRSATAISFKYRFANVGDGDYVAVYLDNVLIWTFAGSSYLGVGEEFLESGPIVIGDLSGERHLTVTLYGVGEPNAQFEIRDFRALQDQSFVNLRVGSGGAALAQTMDSTGAAKTGYADLTVNSGDVPYGTAVFRFKQAGITVSETGVPASPPTTSAQVFIDLRSNVPAVPGRSDSGTVNVNTGIAVVNRGSATANVTYTLRNQAGEPIATGHGTIASGHHYACFIDQLKDVMAPDFNLPPDFKSAIQFASLEITSDQPLSVLALRGTNNQRNDFLLTTTAVADLTKGLQYQPFYFPLFSDGGGYTTSLVLLNTSSKRVEKGILTILDDSGKPMAVNQAGGASDSSFRYSIAPGGVFRFQTAGSPIDIKTGWILVTPDLYSPAPIGSAVFGYNPADVMVSESGIPSADATTHARIYVDLSDNHNTGLALANVAAAGASITISAYQSDGLTPAGISKDPISLPAKGHTAAFADKLISSLPAEFTGVLDIRSSTPFAALTLRSLLNERDDLIMTTFPVADATHAAPSPAIFPQIADGGGYRTQFILLSSGGSSSIMLNFYGETGQDLDIAK
jgi:hypothetical protein